jgi:hypothetical protein
MHLQGLAVGIVVGALLTLATPARGDEFYVTRSDQPPAATPPTPSGPAVAGLQSVGDSPLVCFRLSMQCLGHVQSTPPTAVISVQPVQAVSSVPHPAASNASRHSSLRLEAPDVTHVISAEELQEPLSTPEQEEQMQEAQTVKVQATSEIGPVPGGLASLWWALLHPSSAWRVLAPAQ